MIVMPANATGRLWDPLARETGMLGHLIGPNHHGWPNPVPWFPYALDNGAFSCWNIKTNAFDVAKWQGEGFEAWMRLVNWALSNTTPPRWAIVPDVVGDRERTIGQWPVYAAHMKGLPLAVAVQDGMTIDDVMSLSPQPLVVCVGGTTEWKWETVEAWASSFPRVHLLRCNAPEKLEWLREIGVESCDGTGWGRGDATQIKGLEEYCRRHGEPTDAPLWLHLSKGKRRATQKGDKPPLGERTAKPKKSPVRVKQGVLF